MENEFLIVSRSENGNINPDNLELVSSSENYDFYARQNSVESFNHVRILIDGYVLPRMDYFDAYKQYPQHALINKLYKKHRDRFPQYIKGFFCIVIADGNNLLICNDIHSVKRCFIKEEISGYYISNSLNILRECFPFEINPFAPAIQATFQHFILGSSVFKGIEYSLPASLITISKEICQDTYWNADELANTSTEISDFSSFNSIFRRSVQDHLDYLNPKKISATLTGGRDTRSVLAALKSLNISPHCFTFGYPSGIDVSAAAKVAQATGVEHANHYIDPLDHREYNRLVTNIIHNNNPFIHIHRAHRLDAIIKEEEILGAIDMVFVGAMGGDYIMGESFNDYILTEFLRRYLTKSEDTDALIKSILDKHYVRYSDQTIEFIKDYLKTLGLKPDIFNKSIEFKLVYNLIGCTHDIQDILLFMNHSQYVVAPFMDVDILEALFRSRFSLFYNNRHTKNPFDRLKGGELQCRMIKEFTPELANVNFANQYTPNDVLGNRYKYITKRILHLLFKKQRKPTFTYDSWFCQYTNDEVEMLSPQLADFYDFDAMADALSSNQHPSHEGYWHKYSNPIMLSRYITQNLTSK